MKSSQVLTLGLALTLLGCVLASPLAADDKPEKEKGWTALFDGKTLDGWQGATEGYAVEDGKLVPVPEEQEVLAVIRQLRDRPHLQSISFFISMWNV